MIGRRFIPYVSQPIFVMAFLGLAAIAMALAFCGDRRADRADSNGSVRPPSAQGEPAALSTDMLDIARLIADGRHDLGRLHLQRTLARDPEHGQAHFLYGLAFHREMRYAQARDHFERAIEHAPEYYHTHHFYGYCLYYLGELKAARSAFEAHLAHAPDEGDSHFGIGLIDLDEDNLDAAERRFLRAIELETRAGRIDGVAKSRARLGETYQRLGRLGEARDQLEAATTLNPDLYEAYYILYRVLIRLGEEDAAEEVLAKHDAAKQRVRPEPPTPPPP